MYKKQNSRCFFQTEKCCFVFSDWHHRPGRPAGGSQCCEADAPEQSGHRHNWQTGSCRQWVGSYIFLPSWQPTKEDPKFSLKDLQKALDLHLSKANGYEIRLTINLMRCHSLPFPMPTLPSKYYKNHCRLWCLKNGS